MTSRTVDLKYIYKGGKRFLAVTYGDEDVSMYEEGRRLNKRGTDA